MRLFRNKTPSYRRTVAWERCKTGISDPLHISIARNLKGEKFYTWATEPERRRIRIKLLDALKKAGADFETPGISDVPDEADCEKLSFIPFRGSSVFASLEEDNHISLEIFCNPDEDITTEKAWEELKRIDSLLERFVDWAWTADLGYITTDHGSIGTGMHISGVFHLVGLKMFNDISAVANAFDRLHYNCEFRGKEAGNAEFPAYRISNRHTLGLDEPTLIAKTERLFSALCDHEARARYSLMLEHPLRAFQHVSAALAKINSAFLLSEQECVILLTALSFGVDMEFLVGIDRLRLKELIIDTAKAGAVRDEPTDEFQADIKDRQRAEIIQDALKEVRFAHDFASKWGVFDSPSFN